MASIHTMVTFQAFNGLEHGMVGAYFFCVHTRGSLCLGLKGCLSIRGEDTYVCLRQLWVFITREKASLA